MWADLHTSLHGRLQLMSLELQQAGSALTKIVILAVASGVLLCGAWLALMVALFMGTVESGIHWGVAIAVVFFVNLGMAFVMWRVAFKLTAHLAFPATLRSLSAGVKSPEVSAAHPTGVPPHA